MTAGTWTPYDNGIYDGIAVGSWTVDNHYVVLLTSSYVPSAAHDTLSDVSAYEVADADYSRQDVTGEALVKDAATNDVYLDCDDVDFGVGLITAKYAVLVKGTVGGSLGTDKIVAHANLNTGGSLQSVRGRFKVEIPESGLLAVAPVAGWYLNGVALGVVAGNWATNAHHILLLDDTYTPSTAHTTIADVVAFELADVDYSRLDLAGESLTQNLDGSVTLDLSDVSWGESGTTITGARYAVVAIGTAAGSSNANSLMLWIDLGASHSSDGGEFTITWSASGLAVLS